LGLTPNTSTIKEKVMAFDVWVEDKDGNVVLQKVALNPLNQDSFAEVWEGSGSIKSKD